MLALLVVLSFPASVSAGILARLDLGGGVAQTSSAGLDTRVTGPSASGELAVGYEVLDDVFATVSIVGDVAFDPLRRTGENETRDVGLALYGAGIAGQVVNDTGWFWGGGLYLVRQRARGATGISLDSVALADRGEPLGGPLDDSGVGGGVALKGGRDWQISDSLWSGFAVRAFIAQFDTSAARWSPIAATLSISVSYR